MTTTTETPPTKPGRDHYYDQLLRQPLRRPTEGRWLSGVMASVGNHFGVDPLLIRVGCIVAAVCLGLDIPGLSLIAVYLWATLFIPKDDGSLRIHRALEEGDIHSRLLILAAAVATFVLIFFPHLALLAACFAGALWFVAFRTPGRNAQLAASNPAAPGAVYQASQTSAAAQPRVENGIAAPRPSSGNTGPTPPSPPAPPHQQPPKPRPALPPRRLGTPGFVVLMTWGAAVLAAGAWYLSHRDADLPTQLLPAMSVLAGIPAAVGIVMAGLGRRVWALSLTAMLALGGGFTTYNIVKNRSFSPGKTSFITLVDTSPTLQNSLHKWETVVVEVNVTPKAKPLTAGVEVTMGRAQVVLSARNVPTRININHTSSTVYDAPAGYSVIATSQRGPRTSTSITNYAATTAPVVTLNIDAMMSTVDFLDQAALTPRPLAPTPATPNPSATPATTSTTTGTSNE